MSKKKSKASKLVDEFLRQQPTAKQIRPDDRTHYKFDGESRRGYIQLAPGTEAPQPEQYVRILEEVGLDPAEFKITRVKNFSGWQQRAGEEFLHAYRLDIEPVGSIDSADLSDIVESLYSEMPVKKSRKPAAVEKGSVRVLHIGDLQIGKIENGKDGVKGLLKRYMHTLDEFIPTIEGRPVLVAHVGDCIEGNQSQGGKNMGYQTPLTITEQSRVYRRLLAETVKRLAPHTPRLVIGVVNGNHDEADRRLSTKSGDGWATEAAIAVADSLTFDDEGRYNHVEIIVPPENQGHFTIEIEDTVFTLMHGHQFRSPGGISGGEKWLKDAAYYQQPAASADFVLFGHFHNFQLGNQGPRTLVCSSTYDGGSDWFAERAGGAWQKPYGTAFTAYNRFFKDMSPM